MIVPVVLFVAWVAPRGRGRLCLTLVALVLVVMSPWRGAECGGERGRFGVGGHVVAQGTEPLQGDGRSVAQSGERSETVVLLDVIDKFLADAREMWRDGLPRFGGNWVSAFFLGWVADSFQIRRWGGCGLFL